MNLILFTDDIGEKHAVAITDKDDAKFIGSMLHRFFDVQEIEENV
jgi:hypothetical protein